MMRDKAARSQIYVFDIAVFDISKDFETFDWRWISDRHDRTLAIPKTERHAPYCWFQVVESPRRSTEPLERSVSAD